VDVGDERLESLERQVGEGFAIVVARFDARSRARTGDKVDVAVDVERMYFFDPETGAAIRS
jgi:multiple sugar transport system ATP-binding protein